METTMEVRIRPVARNDLPDLYQFQLEAEANRMALTHPQSSDHFDADWAMVLSDPSVVVRAVVADGVLAGSISCFAADDQHYVDIGLARISGGMG